MLGHCDTRMGSELTLLFFFCDLYFWIKATKNNYLSPFSQALRASCHSLTLLHLDDMLVNAGCWVPAIHARVCRAQTLVTDSHGTKPPAGGQLVQKNQKCFSDLCQFKGQRRAVHSLCSLLWDNATQLSVWLTSSHQLSHNKSNAKRNPVTKISRDRWRKFVMHISEIPFVPYASHVAAY